MEDVIIDLLSDNSRSSNESVENLPPIDFPSPLSSASSSESDSQTQAILHRGKIKGNADINGTCKKASNSVAKNQKKKNLAQEKLVKKRTQEVNKIYKPGKCMKYMKIEMFPSFIERWYASDIDREVAMSGAKVVSTTDLFNPGLILWKRSVPPSLIFKDGQVEMTPMQEGCDRGLYVMEAAEVVDHVCENRLAQHVASIRDLAGVKLTLVVFGDKEYFKSAQKKSKGNKNMTELDLEMAITDLLVSTDCDTVLVNQANELALLIVQFTKAIAEIPYKKLKRACDEQADFYIRGDNKKCVSVDKDGNGLGSLWQQMIAVLPHSSLEISRALCGRYRTPLELYETLQLPDGVKIVADQGVTRSAVPGSKPRRIGTEFARKLYTLFTSEDGNTLIE